LDQGVLILDSTWLQPSAEALPPGVPAPPGELLQWFPVSGVRSGRWRPLMGLLLIPPNLFLPPGLSREAKLCYARSWSTEYHLRP
jgi:hypothetical protein